MDIEILRTFLEVARARHFGRAAEGLCITQSAVSARIRLLEEQVGLPLFDRARNNIQLTAAGARLVPHAEGIINRWIRVRQQIAVEENGSTLISVSGVASLWDHLLSAWLDEVTTQRSKISLVVDSHTSDTQIRRLMDQTLDLAFTWETPSIASLSVQEVARVRLLLVSTVKGQRAQQAVSDHYVLVDWGPAFSATHAELFPGMPPPALRAGLGRIAHNFIMTHGGAAYLAEATISQDLKNKRLFPVVDARHIDRRVYAVYRQDNEHAKAIQGLLTFFKRRRTGGSQASARARKASALAL